MAEEGKRVEVRMGTFACTIEGYDDPISKLKEVMSLVQHMISETPALVDVSADVDHEEIQDAMDGDAAPVRIRKDPEQGETTAPPGDEPASETDGDFILASDDGNADAGTTHDDWHPAPEDETWAETSAPEPAAEDHTHTDAESPGTETPLQTFDSVETRPDSAEDWASPPPTSFDVPEDGAYVNIPDAETPAPVAFAPETTSVESAPFAPPPAQPARRPRPSDTRAGRRLYGMGRFAAGVAGGKRTPSPAAPPMGDAAPEDPAETPLPASDADVAPDFGAAPPAEDLNIFEPEAEAPREIETSWSLPAEDADRSEEPFEPHVEAGGTGDKDSAEVTVEDASTTHFIDSGYGAHAREDNATDTPDVSDVPFALPPEDTTANSDLTAPFPSEPEEPATTETLSPSEPVAGAPEHAEPEKTSEPEEPRRGGLFRSLFGARSRSAKEAGGEDAQSETTAPDQTDTAHRPDVWTEPADLAVNEPQKPAVDREPAGLEGTASDAPQVTADNDSPSGDGDSETEVFNIFASAPEAAEELTPAANLTAEAAPRPEPAADTDTSTDRVGALLTRLQTAREEEDTAPRMSAPGEAEEAGVVAPEAAGVTAADIVRMSGAETVADMLAASAAWLTLTKGKLRFSRRDVMDVFDGLPGDHPKTLEARIKGYGKLVRSGTLVLIGDGQFALAQSDREKFAGLIG